MSWKGRKVQGGNEEKRERLPVMSTLNCVFSHAPFSNSRCLVSDSQIHSLGILLLCTDTALCICTGEDTTTAAINYSLWTPTPQSPLGCLPVCHQHFFQPAFLTSILVLTPVKGLGPTLFNNNTLHMNGKGPSCMI